MRRKKNRSQGKKQPQQTGVNPDGGQIRGGVHSMLLVSSRLTSFSCLTREFAGWEQKQRRDPVLSGSVCPQSPPGTAFSVLVFSVSSPALLSTPDVPFFLFSAATVPHAFGTTVEKPGGSCWEEKVAHMCGDAGGLLLLQPFTGPSAHI